MTETEELAICHDCGALPEQTHMDGCDVERCTVCKGQRLMCFALNGGCKDHNKWEARWTGFWPGELEAAAFGWFCKWGGPGVGWVSCSADDPDLSGPDLNRYSVYEQAGQDPGPAIKEQ